MRPWWSIQHTLQERIQLGHSRRSSSILPLERNWRSLWISLMGRTTIENTKSGTELDLRSGVFNLAYHEMRNLPMQSCKKAMLWAVYWCFLWLDSDALPQYSCVFTLFSSGLYPVLPEFPPLLSGKDGKRRANDSDHSSNSRDTKILRAIAHSATLTYCEV